MANYIIRRLIQAVPLLLLISIIIFGLLRLTPGGPLARFENDPTISQEDLNRIRAEMGLDDPIPVQYGRWLSATLKGDFGESYTAHRPVIEMITERLPNTLKLMSVAFAVTLLVAIPVGVISAVKQYSWFDHLVTAVAFAGQSVPIFWFGLILILVFYSTLENPTTGGPLFPAGGINSLDMDGDFWDGVWHLVLPVTMLSLAWMSWYTRFLRGSMLEIIHQDYVRTARAKGLVEYLVIGRHALINALIPLVTLVALDLPALFAGAVFTETIFSWPGMGRLFYQSALRRDYPVLMAVIMMTAVLIILCNLIADMVYGYLDPRIRYE
ncbi:MAG: ABC transporter permease [Ardenticatenaceae bacterium]|nr:ABC transporter permease [Ardenticatenaceae bacterium]